MAKRMSKGEAQAMGWLLVIGLPIYGVYALGNAIGWGWFVGIIGAAITIFLWIKSESDKSKREAAQHALDTRRAELTEKYHDEKLVMMIMNHEKWQGQTAEQLRDSLGAPEDVDEKVLKTNKREIWKYHRFGSNRFGLRVTVENNVVVGWDEKHLD